MHRVIFDKVNSFFFSVSFYYVTLRKAAEARDVTFSNKLLLEQLGSWPKRLSAIFPIKLKNLSKIYI